MRAQDIIRAVLDMIDTHKKKMCTVDVHSVLPNEPGEQTSRIQTNLSHVESTQQTQAIQQQPKRKQLKILNAVTTLAGGGV